MFISIKNKIVFALITILVSVTSFNLIYSYLMFKNDKETYIFENSLRNSELANEKILDYIKTQSELLATKKIIKLDSFILTGEYLSKSKNFIFNYNDMSFKDDEAEIKAIILTQSKILKKTILLYPFEQLLYLILKQDNGFRFAIIEKKPITERLMKDNIFKYIIHDKHDLIYHGDNSLLKDFKKLVVPNSSQGSLLATSHEKSYLLSYSKIKKLNITTFSYIEQDKAFAVFKNIIIKNLGFSVVILGVFLFISLFFSKKITSPILRLIDKTREIADGNLSGEITVSTNDELQILGSSVNIMSSKIMKLLDEKQDMIEQLKVANATLDDYNKNLEKIVAERTKELSDANNFITAMINSLDQGLFVFDKTKKCLDIFTKACESMFSKIPKGLDVTSLLGLKSKEIEAFEKWTNVIFSNMMPFEGAKSLGPKSVIHSSYGQDDFQFIGLNYYPMLDKDQKLENVVVVATDKTDQVEAEERFKEKDAYVSMILNIIKNKKAFYDFLDEMDDMLSKLSNFSQHEDLSNIAMIAFHSMNGGFANYSISHLVKVARSSESKIKSFLGNRQEMENLLVELIKDFRSERDTLIKEIESQLADAKDKVEIDKKDLAELKERIENNEDFNLLYREYFEKSKISSIFTPYSGLVTQISKKINKPMTPLLIQGGDIRINTDKIKEFSSALVHLFRNCMDHGIESTDKRVESGKPAEGSIRIDCSLEDETLKIVIQDDGGGINVNKVREVLTKKEIDHSELSDKEAIMYIFKPDFSTAEVLTELSGRGVGMSAIDQAIKNLKGTLDLISKEGEGSQFIFELPI